MRHGYLLRSVPTGVQRSEQRGELLFHRRHERRQRQRRYPGDRSSTQLDRVRRLSGNGGGATVSSGATVYFGLGNGGDGVTEALKAIPMPFACTLRNFQVITTSTQSAGGTLVLTVRTQLSSPSGGPVVTVAASAAAGIYSDTTDTATISAGQVIDIQVVNNGSGNSAQIAGWSVGCVPN